METSGHQIRMLYYVLYGLILGVAFILIPFSYFYYEEFDEDVTTGKRILAGLKYTAFLVVILVVLFVIGIFIKPGTPDAKNANEWFEYIVDKQDSGDRSIGFAIACLTILGYLILITYTAYGLTAFPLGLLRGKRHTTEEASDIVSDLEATKEKQREINSRYLSGKKMNDRDQREVDLLKRQEKMLARRGTQLGETQKGFNRILVVCKPFTFLFGILFFLFSLFLFICIILGQIDKIKSSCGAPCGFIETHPELKNPLDLALTGLAPFFPLDYVLLGSIILYVFFTSLSGIIRIGIRFFWIHLYSIRARRSPPQGLLLATLFLMFALLALNMQIITLAPRYTMFGSQVYFDTATNTTQPCVPIANCTMSQIGTIVTGIQMGTPFFGVVYYFATWLFCLVFVIGLIVSLVKRKEANIDLTAEDEDEDDYR